MQIYLLIHQESKNDLCLLVGCSTSQQYVCVSTLVAKMTEVWRSRDSARTSWFGVSERVRSATSVSVCQHLQPSE